MSASSFGAGSDSDKYRTLFEIGQGGTADVALAVAKGPAGFKKLFVVKSLRPAYAQDADFRAMFLNEARLSARLNHPNVVQVYEVFERAGTPTLLMEYVDGQTLEAVLALPEPSLPLDLHLRVLADVLSGLHHSHELLDLKHRPLNVVHRDVSPHNIMVTYEGVVKVLDFGIAKLSGSAVETETGVIKGKLRYMPPEQIAGEEVDRRADVFAVGVLMWEALSGSKLWKGLSDAVIMNRVLNGDVPVPQHATASIAPELRAICRRALASDRQERYQSALDFELAIEEYLAKKSHYVSAREVGRFMAERFGATREKVDLRIESELVRGESSRPPPSMDSARASLPSRTGYTASRGAAAPAEVPPSRLWLGALGLLAFGVALVVWGLRQQSRPPPEAVIAQVAVAPALPQPPRQVRIAIEALPSHAAISVDGAPVSNPYRAERAWDTERHRVRIEAPGFATEETEVRFDSDVYLQRTLNAASDRAPTPSAKPRPFARPAPSISALPSHCEPPFFVDARGIKKFKPECL